MDGIEIKGTVEEHWVLMRTKSIQSILWGDSVGHNWLVNEEAGYSLAESYMKFECTVK